MNKIKLSSVALLAALIISVSESQAQDKPVTLGIKAGANLSTFRGDLKNTKSAFKYQAGITADIMLWKNIYILTGLDLHIKGAKYEPESEPTVKYNPMYLQLPVHWGYKFTLAPGTRFVINAGPYVAYGIGGKAKNRGDSEKVFGDNKLKRLDYGVGGGIGLEFGKLCINGGYDFGINNISDIKDTKLRNRNIYMTLGLKF